MQNSAFDPLRIGPLTLRNRYIKSATNEGMARGGVPSKALVNHHRSMAAGGVGMTTVAYCAVSADGRTFVDQVQLKPETLPHLRALTDAVHREGAAACAQITHGGAFTFLPQLSTRYPLSASGGFNAVGAISGRFLRTGMQEADMETVTQQFVDGARLAREAGFDAVEIHMGHGYLLSQFLSPAYNRRRDQYGGDAAARARYPAQVLRRVLDRVGRDIAVSCKIGVTEGFKKGGTAEEAAVIAKILEREGAHLLVLSGGMNVEAPWAIFGSPMPREAAEIAQNPVVRLASRLMHLVEPKIEFKPLYLREHSLKVRAAVSMPLAYLGGAKSIQGIDQVIADGFDAVVMGRALIHDPDLVSKFASGAATESGCTACNRCVVSMYTPAGTHCVIKAAPDASLNQIPAAP
ncbi:MAG: NADH:flavin oxidoreductase [Hydrocarboniphaga sp.]|uniref:NADH:flavin oxidoreductase n=1 Tax=Hydrocarboniphaga sp. TaxID=2033016 RepID=UPI0026394DA0|nr:NADH:flavin oxidoreductase [Hydrocarboniphaga sp.]MDB5972623.1 NADH:flavin oxidoreductase [Hydrocarboniphaga sp.]